MFTFDVVDIPEKVKFNKKGSTVYVYHVFNSSYSKEKKYTVDKRVLIGKRIDEKTMHPNKTYYELYGEESKKVSLPSQNEFSDTLSVGDITLIQSISENIGLSECLEKVYGENEKDMIINLASYHIIEESSVYQHYPTFAFKHPVLGKKVCSDSTISLFLNSKINDALIHEFFKEWIDKQSIDGRIVVSYDSTNINCESDGVEINEYGKAKDNSDKRIINLSYVFNQKNGTPLFYELYSGSVVDIAECNKMLKLAKQYGLRHALFIADRGYFSNKIIEEIMRNFDGFILMAKTNNKKITELIEDNKENISLVPNYIEKYGVYGIKKQEKLFKQDLDCEKRYFYIYFDEKRYLAEKENLTIIANKNYIEGKELIGTKEEIKEELYPYCKFQIEEGIIKEVEFNQELFSENMKRSGYFVIISSLDEDPSKILDEYRNRDSIEKCFRTLKTDLGISKLGVQSEQNLRSKVFIAFISSIIRNHILQSLAELKKTNRKDYTVNASLRALSRIEATKLPNKSHMVLYSLTKLQKEIIKACGVKLSEINKNYPGF